MKNKWLEINEKFINHIMRQCVERSLKSSYKDEIPFESLNRIIRGSIIEIEKLQNEVDSLKKQTLKK